MFKELLAESLTIAENNLIRSTNSSRTGKIRQKPQICNIYYKPIKYNLKFLLWCEKIKFKRGKVTTYEN